MHLTNAGQKTSTYRFTMILLVVILTMTSFAPANRAYAESLSGSEQRGTILASVLFSQGNSGKSIDSAAIPLGLLSQYPVTDDHDQIYGRLLSPNFNDFVSSGGRNTAGNEAASYIEDLYRYGWICSIPKDDNTPVLGFVNNLFRDTSNGFESVIFSKMIDFATMGASVYDTVFGIAKGINNLVSSFNIPSILGLSKTGAVDSPDAPTEDTTSGNIFTNFFTKLLTDMGFGDGQLMIIQIVTTAIIATALAVVLMSAFAGSRGIERRRMSKAKIWAMRLLVIGLTLPVTTLLTDVFVEFDKFVDNGVHNSVQEVNGAYVVDTLKFASTTNLNLSLLGDNHIPNEDNVQKINRIIREKSASAWGTENSGDGYTGAADALNALSSRRQVSVASYFSDIASAESGTISANSWFTRDLIDPNSGKTISGGPAFPSIDGNPNLTPCFLSPSNFGDTPGLDPEKNYAHYHIESGGNTLDAEIKNDSKYVFKQVSLDNPETYIYGAVTSGAASDTQVDHANFIAADGTKQNLNPDTGKLPDENGKMAGNLNALQIAILNKYAGLEDGSFSTQSTAFLLQSYLDPSNVLHYSGYQTVSNDPGSAKNTGVNGNAFAQFTMPNSGDADAMVKAGKLNLTWITAAVAAVLALLALLRAPIFSAIWNATKGLLKSLFTGDIFGLLEYAIYFSAFKFSFIFLSVAISAGVMFARMFISISSMWGLDWIAGGNSAGAVIGSVTSPLGVTNGLMFFIMGLCVALVMAYPMVNMTVGGKPRKLSIVAALVMVPYLVAESMVANFDMYRSRLYGTSSQGVLGSAKRNASMISGAEHKENFKKAAGTVVSVGAAVATTGGSVGMTAATSQVVAKAGAKAAGQTAVGAATGAGKGVAGHLVGAALDGKESADKVKGQLEAGDGHRKIMKDAMMAGIRGEDDVKTKTETTTDTKSDVDKKNQDLVDAKNADAVAKDFNAKTLQVDDIRARSIGLDNAIDVAGRQLDQSEARANAQAVAADKSQASAARSGQQTQNIAADKPIDAKMHASGDVIDVQPVSASGGTAKKPVETMAANSAARVNDTAGQTVNAKIDGFVNAKQDQPIEVKPMAIGQVPKPEVTVSQVDRPVQSVQQVPIVQQAQQAQTVQQVQQAQTLNQQVVHNNSTVNQVTNHNTQTTTTQTTNHTQAPATIGSVPTTPIQGQVTGADIRDEIRHGMHKIEKETSRTVDDAVARETDAAVRRRLSTNRRKQDSE